MLTGYCGTLMTPMAANFNIVPAALLELDDPYAVIRAQIADGDSAVGGEPRADVLAGLPMSAHPVPHVLLTGFAPFGGEATNPSWEAVARWTASSSPAIASSRAACRWSSATALHALRAGARTNWRRRW